jgi:hypothetical protein
MNEETTAMTGPLWQPSPQRIEEANLTAFMGQVEADWGVACRDYGEVYAFSVDQMEKFWRSAWNFFDVIAETQGEIALAQGDRMPGAAFFPEARLNYAENLLRRRDDADAMVFWGEDKVKRRVSYRELHDTVARLAKALEDLGVGEGDRVAGFMPNMPAVRPTSGSRVSLTASDRSSPRCCSARTAITTTARPTTRSPGSPSSPPSCPPWTPSSWCPT